MFVTSGYNSSLANGHSTIAQDNYTMPQQLITGIIKIAITDARSFRCEDEYRRVEKAPTSSDRSK